MISTCTFANVCPDILEITCQTGETIYLYISLTQLWKWSSSNFCYLQSMYRAHHRMNKSTITKTTSASFKLPRPQYLVSDCNVTLSLLLSVICDKHFEIHSRIVLMHWNIFEYLSGVFAWIYRYKRMCQQSLPTQRYLCWWYQQILLHMFVRIYWSNYVEQARLISVVIFNQLWKWSTLISLFVSCNHEHHRNEQISKTKITSTFFDISRPRYLHSTFLAMSHIHPCYG